MNLFILDNRPSVAARYHCDKHVVKMVLETAQLLSTAHRLHDEEVDGFIYQATHFNHPCSIWVRKCAGNYRWTYRLFKALAKEYHYRYGRQHKSWLILQDRLAKPPRNIPRGRQTPFALAMPDKYKQDDAVQAYRDYYIGDKSEMFTFTRRDIPDWVGDK